MIKINPTIQRDRIDTPTPAPSKVKSFSSIFTDNVCEVKNLSLEEKIGQKIMLDFRYWNKTVATSRT